MKHFILDCVLPILFGAIVAYLFVYAVLSA